MPVWLSFEPAGLFVNFEKRVKISELLSFYKFCDNRYVSLQTAETLYKSFLMETSKPSAGISFTAPKTSFIIIMLPFGSGFSGGLSGSHVQ